MDHWCKGFLDWDLIDCERLVHFLWKTRKLYYGLVVLVSYHKQAATKLHYRFLLLLVIFLWTGTTFSFFHSVGNCSLSTYDLNTSSKGFKVESSQIFSMWILIMSLSWALFGLKLLMIVVIISFLVNEIAERRLLVFLKESVESFSVLSTKVHYLAKKDLRFLFKVCNIIAVMINWWNTRYFFVL